MEADVAARGGEPAEITVEAGEADVERVIGQGVGEVEAGFAESDDGPLGEPGPVPEPAFGSRAGGCALVRVFAVGVTVCRKCGGRAWRVTEESRSARAIGG